MSCASHGDLLQNPTWVKIEENNVTILTEGSELLEVKNVTAQSEGLYACVVGNSMGSVYSEAYLSVALNSNSSVHNTSLKVSCDSESKLEQIMYFE